MRHPLSKVVVLLLGAFTLSACDDSIGVNDPAAVALNFQVSTESSAQATSGPAATSGPLRVAGPPLALEGTNGTLTIDEIRLIVAEVELDGDDDACEDQGEGDDCADFEAPPRFLDLPLDGTPVEAFVGLIPPNTYDELEFEIEDLEDDEDDTEFAAEIEALRAEILDEFPDWPDEATALVAGSFESTDGEVSSFRVFLEAEIEVERDLIPPLVVGESDVNPDLTIDIRPEIWFGRSDGSVLELQSWDYDSTGRILEFEVEMENGFTEIEIDD
ncbi:MAG: hypothetical protein U5R14_09905 [Gemmatimonadota bacterium]|nr:hypothetical protein [Gemmatimonadota bacterium]